MDILILFRKFENYLTLLSTLIAVNIFCQVPAELPVQVLNEASGLTQLQNYFLYKDSQGFLWISSTNGLYRFDGAHTTLYKSDPADSLKMLGTIVNGYFGEDKDHNIWFCTYSALNCNVRQDDSFLSYKHPIRRGAGFFGCGMDSIGQYWMIKDNMLCSFNTTEKTFEDITEVKPDANRSRLILTDKGEVSRVITYNLNRNDFGFQISYFLGPDSIRTQRFLDEKSNQPLSFRDLYFEHDTAIWLATGFGLVVFNSVKNTLSKYAPFPQDERIPINAICSIDDTTLLIGTYGKGLYSFNTKRRIYNEHFWLDNNGDKLTDPIQALYRDQQNGVWITIPGKGVAYYNSDNFTARTYKHEISTSINISVITPNSILPYKDYEVFLTSSRQGGFVMKDASKIERLFNRDVNKNWTAFNTTQSVNDTNGNIWVLTANGPICLMPNDSIAILQPPTTFFVCLADSKKGYILMGHEYDGLYKSVTTPDRKIYYEKIASIPDSFQYTRMITNNDGLLFGSCNLNTFTVHDLNQEFKLIASHPLEEDTKCMVEMNEGKNIWIGTDHGIYVYTIADNTLHPLTSDRAITELSVYGIIPYKGKIWISSNNGIYQISTQGKIIRHIDKTNGTGRNEFNSGAFLSRGNELWFGNYDGITVIYPDRISPDQKPPLTNISSLFINNQDVRSKKQNNARNRNTQQAKSLRYPYSQNTISFSFAAIDYRMTGFQHYQYRMVGVGQDWIDCGNPGYAFYPNLPSGNYTFEVRAHDPVTDASGEIRSIQFEIIPPLYQKPWFVILSFLIGAGATILLIRNNEQRKLKLQQLRFEKRIALESERLRIANDMHDDIGSGLSALSLRAKLLENMATEPGLQLQLHDFVESTTHLAQKIREIIWTISSKNDTIDNLVTHLHQYALDYFEGSDTDCKVELAPQQILTAIPGHHRRDIYLCFKEALHNIVKHAHSSLVHIRIHFEGEHLLVIHITDNGIGFDERIKTNGLGLQSMRERIEDIGGSFEINSGTVGTSIAIRYPF